MSATFAVIWGKPETINTYILICLLLIEILQLSINKLLFNRLRTNEKCSQFYLYVIYMCLYAISSRLTVPRLMQFLEELLIYFGAEQKADFSTLTYVINRLRKRWILKSNSKHLFQSWCVKRML